MKEIIQSQKTEQITLQDIIYLDGTYIAKKDGKYMLLGFNPFGRLMWGNANRSSLPLPPFGNFEPTLTGIKDAITAALNNGFKVYQFESIDEALKSKL